MKSLIQLLGVSPIALKVIGGSVISSYGLPSKVSTIASVVQDSNTKLYLKREICVGGLGFSQAIPLIEGIEKTDVLVLYFGTSVGWPRISRKLENHLRPELMSQTAFHLPAYKSKKLKNRFRAKIRHLERNIMKFVLFPFGMYKPRHSIEDLPSLIAAIEHLAEKRSKLIIWVQHNSLGYRRLWLERKVYKRYYKEILETLNNCKSPHFRILTPSKNFLIQENFLVDGVHLSEIGHLRMGKLIADEIDTALDEAKRYANELNR